MGAMGSNKARHNFQEETNRYFFKKGKKTCYGLRNQKYFRIPVLGLENRGAIFISIFV